ncbi:tRNA (cytosine(34)-C(5))-methyltransferase [Colias croceus]|uniref:tRNA (cytosine(34)-C(5))-methyltransferase n=1 Tax=Colias crocea TaxID=72248 RepID=UPI001E27A778|nr:tRNA (cytosine(34)-C(5))-methyltransferase [Colias croceus]
MGRKNRNVNKFAQRKREKREQEKNPQPKPTEDNRKHYEDIVRENAVFEEYYKAQKVCPDAEWDEFMKSLKENLPTAFRITGSKCEANALMKIVTSQYFSEILNMKLKVDGQDEEIKPINLPWYPGGLAWQLRLSRTDIRRSEPLYKLHNFLVAETAAGGVSRQEAVSMIPPVALQVEPHHKVLDMCAAPGSKTAQLIEFLHADEDKMPTGFVIANDVDNSRCYMLVHQAKRLNSPSIIITNHDSAVMPTLTITDPENPEATKALKYDRILCDVPCSGDATLRKNPDIWLKWSTGNGNNLHGIQYRILRRGCELLELGGRLVYSTCSFNPIENEAVVHRLLQEAGDSVRLVDVAEKLPGLKFIKGMTYWRPASKDMVFYEKYEDVPEKWQTVVRPQMFPPTPESAAKYHLDKCIRILPHHQDTGGFFVAVFEKVNPLPWEKDQKDQKEESKEEVEKKEEKKEPPKKKRRLGGYKEDPFVFFSGENEDVFPSIKEYYDLNEFDASCLLTRCHVGKKKNIYLVSPIVKDIVKRNEANIKIINTGVKTFVRCDNKNMTCAFRLSQEGLQSIVRYIGPKRRVQILKEDLIVVLQNDDVSNPPHLTMFSEHTQKLVKDLPSGSCVLEYNDEGMELKLVGWRGVHSLRAYTASSDTVHYLRLLGADYSKYDLNKFKKADVPESSEATENTEDIAMAGDGSNEIEPNGINESKGDVGKEDSK